MSKTENLFLEAINPLTKIANSIVKKLNYIETSLILKTTSPEEGRDFLLKTAAYHSNAFDDLDSDKKEQVIVRIWEIIHNTLSTQKETKETENSNLEQKIYEFLKMQGGILYPYESSAKNLAAYLKKED